MFVYVIDTTLMNVSISALVEDLNTDVGKIQGAITIYTLTMAAFMLTGGKLGDIWGSKNAFRIGLIVYGIGTITTAFAQNIWMLLIGWSILEGLGSALIVPAINTLVRANFSGSRRASAYGVIFGVAAAGAAFGPLLGGWITANLSWRVAFAGEAVIVLLVLLSSGLMSDAPRVEPKPKLDRIGVVLSAAGLGMLVFGILQTTDRGLRDALVLTLILGGLVLLGVFIWWIRRREAQQLPVLVHPSIFRHKSINAGLPVLATQTFAQGGLLFLVPLFSQMFLGLDAFETGLVILPLSISVLITSVATPRLGRIIYPKWIIQGGLVVLALGGFRLSGDLEGITAGSELALSLTIVGVGMGLVIGQLSNLVLSGVEPTEASEASGLQGTAQNLGLALGTAIVGSVILVFTVGSFSDQVATSTVIPDESKDAIEAALEENARVLSSVEFADAVAAAPPEIQDEVDAILEVAVVRGFRAAVVIGGLVALIGFLVAFRLPKAKLEDQGLVEETVRTASIPALQLEMTDL